MHAQLSPDIIQVSVVSLGSFKHVQCGCLKSDFIYFMELEKCPYHGIKRLSVIEK